MFECKKCKKCFDFESEYLKHIEISSNCKLIVNIEIPNKCQLCNRVFSNKSSLNRHKKKLGDRCKSIFDLQKAKDELKKEITSEILSEIKKQQILSITNNSFTQNIFNTNNQYLFCKPGDECVKHITKEVVLELLNMDSFTGICVSLMQDAYFNRGVPKNHNWCIVYPNNDKAAVVFDHDKSEFTREKNTKVIDEKFFNLMQLLTPVLLEIIEEEDKTGFLNEKQKRNLFRIKHFYNVDELSNESTEIYDKIHDLAYENRKIPMETWDKSGLKGNHLSLKFK